MWGKLSLPQEVYPKNRRSIKSATVCKPWYAIDIEEDMKNRNFTGKSAQDIQDEIFRSMSADKKLELGSQLWMLARVVAGSKLDHGTNRPETSSRQRH